MCLPVPCTLRTTTITEAWPLDRGLIRPSSLGLHPHTRCSHVIQTTTARPFHSFQTPADQTLIGISNRAGLCTAIRVIQMTASHPFRSFQTRVDRKLTGTSNVTGPYSESLKTLPVRGRLSQRAIVVHTHRTSREVHAPARKERGRTGPPPRVLRHMTLASRNETL